MQNDRHLNSARFLWATRYVRTLLQPIELLLSVRDLNQNPIPSQGSWSEPRPQIRAGVWDPRAPLNRSLFEYIYFHNLCKDVLKAALKLSLRFSVGTRYLEKACRWAWWAAPGDQRRSGCGRIIPDIKSGSFKGIRRHFELKGIYWSLTWQLCIFKKMTRNNEWAFAVTASADSSKMNQIQQSSKIH